MLHEDYDARVKAEVAQLQKHLAALPKEPPEQCPCTNHQFSPWCREHGHMAVALPTIQRVQTIITPKPSPYAG